MSAALTIDALSWVALIAGGFFYVVGAIGLIRMPDIFSRMHAVSVSETLGVGLLIGGMLLQAGPTLVAVKLIFILLMLLMTGPVATHALAHAALHDKMEPLITTGRGGVRPLSEAQATVTIEELSTGKTDNIPPTQKRAKARRAARAASSRGSRSKR